MIFATHPEVRIDSQTPVVRWGLSDMGRDRMTVFASSETVSSVGRIICSDETKALEAASVVAVERGLPLEVRPGLGENDRTATGFKPPHEFERLADAFFARPTNSVEGWETAEDAQRRVVEATADLLASDAGATGDVLVVGHGAVGTLLYCHLAGLAIDRAHDQPHQGCYFTVDLTTGAVVHPWKTIT